MNEGTVKLSMNKAVSFTLRPDADVDVTALRVGKNRIARRKVKRSSALKAAIIDSRLHGTETLPHNDSAGHLGFEELSHTATNSVSLGAYMDYGECPDLDDIMFGILKELARLQAKGKDQPSEKQYKFKKFVVGFREVYRALKRGELKGIVISTNLEAVPELTEMIGSLHSESKEREVPIIFALTRRRMGKALGKSMKQSLAGIVNLDGVHQPWKQALDLVESLRCDNRLISE